ncbi:FAD-dependent oxidoreductase [Streptomyces sp. NBC_00144]|uniref:flavin monoamine oxidase family protein n=1 Tax=Streptomyces sp. NBC_00144 TaxID=2975665 RepID=UPI003246A9D8
MPVPRQDTIVIGGGLAGLVIARELCAAGRLVTVLEARSRLGGRAYYDSIEGTDEYVELGGNWFDPSYQPLLAAEIDRYGLKIVHGDPGTDQRTVIGGRVLHGQLPVPYEDIVYLERGVWECLAASRRINYGQPWEEQGVDDLDVSWADYVRSLRLSPAVEEYMMTWTSASNPEETSALNIIVLFATFGHSAWAAYNSMELKFAEGTASLVDAITAEVRAEVHLDTAVTHVEQTAEEVIVTTADGRTFKATNAVLATPVNTWADVTFTPPLSKDKQEVARSKHVGTGQKIWMQLTDTPEGGVFGWGFGKGVNWLMRDRKLPEGGDLYVGFTGGGRLDTSDHDSIREAVRVFAPEAEVTRVREHDWLADEYSKGVWAVYRPGHFTRLHSALSQPEDRLQFAGSDVSFGQQLWMEGAFETAFRVTDDLLGRG